VPIPQPGILRPEFFLISLEPEQELGGLNKLAVYNPDIFPLAFVSPVWYKKGTRGFMRIIGIDPGLQCTGWGVVEAEGSRLRHIAHGVIRTAAGGSVAERLVSVFDGLAAMITLWMPDEAAVEETFVNRNAASSLKLGQARGVAMLAPARAGLVVAEYPASLVKKSVTGAGHAEKPQVQAMIRVLLPGITAPADAADALAVAICHAHHAATRRIVGGIMAGGVR
jgi:crossover junction endodeoxyribonuclease RuvC